MFHVLIEEDLAAPLTAKEHIAMPVQYETLVMLGPPPLTVADIGWNLLAIGIVLTAAACGVGVLYLLMQLAHKIL